MVHLSEKEINAQDFSLKYFGDTLLISFHGWYDYSFTQDYSKEKLLAFKNSFTLIVKFIVIIAMLSQHNIPLTALKASWKI